MTRTRTASLPIYDLPELRTSNERFWTELRRLFIAERIDDADLPERLDDGRSDGEAIFTQVCGYPLQTIARGRYALLGTPIYDAPGCSGSMHRAFIVVRDDAPFFALADLRGRTFAVNDAHSNTGMNLPRRLFADLARDGSFFGTIRSTGSHAASVVAVRDGLADAASIDCVTYAFLNDHRPNDVAGLRILAQTPQSPAIPFVASLGVGPERIDRLRAALHDVSTDDRLADVRAGLRLRAVVPARDDDYAVLVDYEREAATLGYPVLA